MFAFPLPEKAKAHVSHDCCDSCREAREIKCVCACGGKNHGSALKRDVKRLDQFDSEDEDESEDARRYIA